MSLASNYKDVYETVERYLTRSSNITGWHIDAESLGDSDKVNIFPFASEKGAGFRLLYTDSKRQISGKCSFSNYFTSVVQFLPTIKYEKKVDAFAQTVEFEGPTGVVKYTAAHPAFTASLKSCLADGFASLCNISVRLGENVYAGAEADYDPKRSGLKNMTICALRENCPIFQRGDILGKYSLVSGLGLQLRVPVNNYTDVAVISENNRFIVGCQGRSPCGAIMMVNANLSDGSGTFTAIRNVKDIWKVSLTYTTPLVRASSTMPKFGLKLSSQD